MLAILRLGHDVIIAPDLLVAGPFSTPHYSNRFLNLRGGRGKVGP
jgi:hypothetical protein